MRALGALLAAVCAAGWCGAARGALGTLDDVPASTLLLPYFEVDLQDPNGGETVLSVHNAGAAAVAAHLTLWTDAAVPVLSFDVLLAAADVEEINLREVFEGRYPHQGVRTCGGAPSPIGGTLENALAGTTGRPVADLGGICIGADHGDDRARGYLTIGALACDEAAGAGLILTPPPNVLWGDYRLVDREGGRAVGEPLVAIESNQESTAEPFPPRWGVRYLALPGSRTDLIVWRDIADATGVGCGPPQTDTNVAGIHVFNDNGMSAAPIVGLPRLTASRVQVGDELPVPFTSGWILLDLADTDGGYVSGIQLLGPIGIAVRGLAMQPPVAE